MCVCVTWLGEKFSREIASVLFSPIISCMFTIDLNQGQTLLVGMARSLLKISSISALLGASAIFDVLSKPVQLCSSRQNPGTRGESWLLGTKVTRASRSTMWFFTRKRREHRKCNECNKKHTSKVQYISPIAVHECQNVCVAICGDRNLWRYM